jgi:uncharacterized protein (DUF2252 family)
MTAAADAGRAFPGGSPEERSAAGKALRSETPRVSHAEWEPAPDRPDPISLLEAQAADRLSELVPIRYGRMQASPFSFFRGAACVMASDLAGTPRSGIRVQLCGDAHLSNFGGFASPERDLVFDLNDFDETLPGPWEWDVKRLAASVVVAGRDNGFAPKRQRALVRQTVGEYRKAMRGFAGMKALDVWYARASVGDLHELLRSQASSRQAKRFDRAVARGRRKDSARALEKLAVSGEGDPRIAADPPLIVPIEDLVNDAQRERIEEGARGLLGSYVRSLSGDRRRLLQHYRYAALARKVVGVGSVGTRAWVLLLLGRDSGDPLFLQLKEAQRSVLEPFAGRSRYRSDGRRVVEGQRLMQAAGDILLGWLHSPHGVDDNRPRDFYVRQLWDSKTSADVAAMRPDDMALYARLCAWTLARAHARSGDSLAISAYLGSSEAFEQAVAAFACVYADQNERDYAALLDAVAAGRIEAQTGV